MNKSIILTIAVFALAACKGSGNNGNNGDKGDMAGNNGGGNFTVLSATVTLAAGQGGCANGGVQVNVGLDNGDGGGVARDGTLQDGEIDTNKVICNAAPGNTTTVTLQTPVGLGNLHCMFGGTQIDYGLDNGEGGGTAGNGMLEPGEIDGTTYACLSKPANLLVVTTAIFAGDPQCLFGGQLITSGLDDGQPSGTADNGKFDPGEDTTTIAHCNAAPDEVFPAPTGAAGTATIDVSGGSAPGVGSSDSGWGGAIQVAAYGGPAPTSIEAYKNGTVTVDTTVPQPSFTEGAHKIEIDSNTQIPMVYAPAEGLHVRVDLEADPPPWGWPIYDGDTVVTAIHVQAGKTLTFVSSEGLANIVLGSDVLNEGTISAARDIEGTLFAIPLRLECHNFINKGVVDLRSRTTDETAGFLEIWAVNGADGQLWNGPGAIIRTDGWDAAAEGAPGGSEAAELSLIASGTLFNGGTITASGGTINDDYATIAHGSNVILRTLRGNIVNAGSVASDAAQGSANAGVVLLFNGVLDFGDLSNPWPLPNIPSHPVLASAKAFGPGAYLGAGSISAHGSHNQATGSGNPGQVLIRMQGGAITSTTTIDVSGTSYENGSYGELGRGGRIFIGDFAWVGVDGGETPVFPSGITLGGSLLAQGGFAKAGQGYANSGGEVDVVLDLLLTGRNAGEIGGGELWPSYDVPVAALAGHTDLARIQFLGYGKGFLANGGSSGSNGGNGGAMRFSNDVCNSEAAVCAFTHIGARLLVSDVDLLAKGGDGQNGGFGVGGDIRFGSSNQNNNGFVPATIDSARILSKGTIDASSGAGYFRTSSPQPHVEYTCEACDVLVSGDIKATGGSYTYDYNVEGPDFGGGGGGLDIAGFTVTMSSTINLAGGEGPDEMGPANFAEISCYVGTNTGKLLVPSGGGEFYTYLSFTNAGEISFDGAGATTGTSRVFIGGASFINSGTFSARGFSGETASDGGEIDIETSSLTNTGTVDASGGDTSGEGSVRRDGGHGGYIYVDAGNGSQMGSLLARGGKATSSGAESSSSYGGIGGTIGCAMVNDGTIDVSGGDAVGGTYNEGGYGGSIQFYDPAGANAKTANASGGDGVDWAGDGGTISFDPSFGTNTGCANVSGGTGAKGGVDGTISPEDTINMCGA